MNLFIIVLPETIPEDLVGDVKSVELVAGVCRITDSAMLVRSYASNPQMLAERFGMSGTTPSTKGVVFKLNGSYFGYYREDLWKWLEESRA